MHCNILITDGNAEKNISLPSVSLYSSRMIRKFQITMNRAEIVKEVSGRNSRLWSQRAWIKILALPPDVSVALERLFFWFLIKKMIGYLSEGNENTSSKKSFQNQPIVRKEAVIACVFSSYPCMVLKKPLLTFSLLKQLFRDFI